MQHCYEKESIMFKNECNKWIYKYSDTSANEDNSFWNHIR